MVWREWEEPQYNKDYFYWKNKYLNKFGKHSLDRVIRPLYEPFLSPSEERGQKEIFEGFILKMKKAIEKNEPFEQADPEVWNKLRF